MMDSKVFVTLRDHSRRLTSCTMEDTLDLAPNVHEILAFRVIKEKKYNIYPEKDTHSFSMQAKLESIL